MKEIQNDPRYKGSTIPGSRAVTQTSEGKRVTQLLESAYETEMSPVLTDSPKLLVLSYMRNHVLFTICHSFIN